MENFYSNIGKNTTKCEVKHYTKNARSGNLFSTSKRSFVDMLKRQGCTICSQSGNYVTVEKNGVKTILYFAWHNQSNANYILNKYIKQRVDYFAFCTHDATKVYFVSYDKISKYCRDIEKSYVFEKSAVEKLLIPDSWVHSQIANKM